MEFGLILSLKEMTRRRVAVSLWNHDDIVTLIKTFAFSPYFHAEMFHKGNILYDRIIGKIEKLLLPTALEDELRETTYSVGLEILKFNFFQGEYLNEDNRFFFDNEIKIYWTVLGTIDKIRTAMSFVKDDKFDFTLRYKIACIYCLEDDIPILWEKMAQDKKISIKTDSLAIIYQVLIYFWESEMKKELFKLHELRRMNENVYVDALEYAACNGNIAATRYFFQKLSDEEKRKEGLRMTKKILRAVEFYKRYHSEVLQFLLLQMSEKDRLNVFQTCSYNLLCSFLEWPLQPYINDLAGLVWSYLDPSEFFELFRYIAVRNLLYKGRGCDYQSLFSGLWSGSPLHFKKYIILEKQWEQLLCLLYEAGDTGSASLILKMLAPEQVERFITGNPGLNLIHRLS
ncbi:ANK_REP_REGION domain-containing protein [Trichonephila clavipes]|nr:ANK_REP_REGION domain-containing protein [Trichonephila clavipes]